jgi:autotransporter strand-loop-strand O-heptosyltransferase
MRIIQVTPGVIPIPPNGWGAVEKIIWEYKLCLDKLGWTTDILYADDVKKSDNQIVHVHMANLANLLHSRGIDYVFSLHDHHVEHFGKGSDCYNENYKAIKNSKLTFVHSKHLIEYFENLPNIVYLPHGANKNDYKLIDRSGRLLDKNPELLMMANNGVGGNPLSDRKGFLIGIEAAKKLNLNLTIICPSSNKKFFEYHNVKYDKINIHYDLDYQTTLSMMDKFDIFLHPSNLEAGHPNLTLTESISSGIPVVGVINTDIPGMIRVERGVDDFVEGIKLAIKSYDSLIGDIIENKHLFSWEIVVSRMLENYKKFFKISQRNQLIKSYQSTKINGINKIDNIKVSSSFSSYKTFLKTSFFSPGSLVLFKDKKTNSIVFNCEIGKEPGNWSYISSDHKSFLNHLIEVKQGVKVIYKDFLDLTGKRVLLEITEYFEGLNDLIRLFQDKENCFITIKSDLFFDNFQLDPSAKPENFYFTLTQDQLKDYFINKPKKSEKILFILNSNALGDTIGFLPYAQKWASLNNKNVDVSIKFGDIFDKSEYPNLNIIPKESINFELYTDISRFDYDFNKPLQMGYSDLLELDYKEISAKIKNVESESPIKNKYVILGIHTTAQCKYWNYPGGWEIISKELRKMGYTPVALDLYEVFGIEGSWNYLPNSAVKKVGLPMTEVIRYLNHCEFFIGVSSGLSWLSWSLGKKVIMISGVTEENNEFQSNNYRVIKKSVCNGCFNSKKYLFDQSDWMWCPVNKETDKWFECSKMITPNDVLEKVNKIINKL